MRNNYLLAVTLFVVFVPARFSQAENKTQNWWVSRFRGPMATRVGKNHELVKNAFSDVVSSANDATVRIYKNDSQVALGLVIDQLGHAITKASEIGGQTVECKVKGGRSFPATVVSVDDRLDIALLRIQSTKLKFAALKAAPAPTVGAWLATTGGIRDEPLAIGVVSVPARRIEQQSGVLGVMIDDAKTSGAKVNDVLDDSAAKAAGVRIGDVITVVDGRQVSNSREVITLLSKKRPGVRVKVTVVREEEQLTLSARLGRFSDIAMGEQLQAEVSGPLSQRRSGFSSALQHDIVLRPNQCGGPVVDIDGRVVGINIARAGRVESYAVTTSEILSKLPDLMSGKLAAR